MLSKIKFIFAWKMLNIINFFDLPTFKLAFPFHYLIWFFFPREQHFPFCRIFKEKEGIILVTLALTFIKLEKLCMFYEKIMSRSSFFIQTCSSFFLFDTRVFTYDSMIWHIELKILPQICAIRRKVFMLVVAFLGAFLSKVRFLNYS